MRTWEKEFAGTWLAHPRAVHQFDARVRAALRRHRPEADEQTVAPWSVDVLARDIDRLAREQNWLWCSAAIALLAELIFCSDVSGTFATRRGYLPYHLEANLETLRILRNAIFHPAHQTTSAGSGNPPIAQLVSKLETLQETEVSLRLAENWSFLGDREITRIALRQLDSAGRLRAEHLGIDIDRQGGHG